MWRGAITGRCPLTWDEPTCQGLHLTKFGGASTIYKHWMLVVRSAPPASNPSGVMVLAAFGTYSMIVALRLAVERVHLKTLADAGGVDELASTHEAISAKA